MLREKLRENGEILYNILNQPLTLFNQAEKMSLVQVAKSYVSEQAEASDLGKLLHSFTNSIHPVETLIRELHLLSNELNG